MPAYVIVYYFARPDRDRAMRMRGAIESGCKKWWNVTEGTWLVESESTASALRELLMPHIAERDETLLVFGLSNSASWFVGADLAPWLESLWASRQ